MPAGVPGTFMNEIQIWGSTKEIVNLERSSGVLLGMRKLRS